ncbi:MAG: GTP-binding protein [Lachnospiraceae bacterium]|jgi:G3E family GTPase|nr:GTP-binding protein [Lachnospiraceae bacterium]
MTKIDIFSGFLGAGKTTLIKKLLQEALDASKVVLIENEFGEIGIDGGFLKEAGVEIKEMNSGCICCSLVGDFGSSLKEVIETYHPERILIEPSGVGKLSDVMKAVQDVDTDAEVELNSAVVVVDANKCRMYAKNFGEFFLNQIEHAGTIILSRTADISESKLDAALDIIREHNDKATVITTPWEALDGKQILETIENAKDLEAELMAEVSKLHDGHHDHEGHHHHDHDHEGHDHHHDHEEECTCGCHDHEGHGHHCDHDHEGHGHHCDHDHEGHHDHEHGCHDHDHHHEHGEECTCGCHDHDHHHHHHADEIFASWGFETPTAYTREELEHILEELEDEKKYGSILRAKGMVSAGDGTWLNFDYVPGEGNVRTGAAEVTGKICVIGAQLNEENLKTLFRR